MWKILLSLVVLIILVIVWWILHCQSHSIAKGDATGLTHSEPSFLDDLSNLVEEVAEILVPHLPYSIQQAVPKSEPPASPMLSPAESFRERRTGSAWPRQSASPRIESPLLSGRVTSRPKYLGEHLVASALTELLGSAPIRNDRPSWLRNPATKRNLELDCWYPELRLAIEYQGIQHYEFPNPFHRSQIEFEQALQRDTLKRELCDAHGIYLIPIPCTVDDVELRGTRYVTLRRSAEERYSRLYAYLGVQLQTYYEQIAALEHQ